MPLHLVNLSRQPAGHNEVNQLAIHEFRRHAECMGHGVQRHALVRLQELHIRNAAHLAYIVSKVRIQIAVRTNLIRDCSKCLQASDDGFEWAGFICKAIEQTHEAAAARQQSSPAWPFG